ncbi:V-type ATP synthase subunit I [Thiocapsa roseopersicina]|uniref:V/A-type H+-transporting ATPase subunit I n=1 Tax=Thiocapsa roseopersicina TaxID=1058 RepID=A0A1H2SUS5_THIRO|nr:V-type ATPase 116kDa subunit family protein [Thiocapsa roseopersicina]SDW35195.1 V/A-type H+-transporting ATPase subunit I [Thiocapsa roseopersicina]
MLRSTPMKHVRLLVLTEDLPQASLALADMESFHPDTRPPTEARLAGLPGREYREVFTQATARLEKIGKLIPVPQTPEIEEVRVVDFAELQTLNAWLGKVWNESSAYEEDLRRLDDEERLVKEQQAALANFAHLNIDLGMLRSKTRFLDFYVGLVPRENLRQLEGAVGLAGYILHVYMQQDENAHVVIVGPAGTKESQLSAVLDAAGFQNLPIPQELDRTPAELQRDLDAQRKSIDAQRKTLLETLARWSDPFAGPLLEARRTLMLAEPLVSLDPSIRSAGYLAYLAGWVPARSVERLDARLRESLNHPFEMSVRNPTAEERVLVPTVPAKSWILSPFAMLVKQYGVPEYGEVDPTPLFAVTFVLMFGSMFGDIGQGAVIALAAWLLRKKLGRFWPFGLMAGLSSMVFGVLFGSIFGEEHLIPALWMSPLGDPLLMMRIALGWGVVFLTIACLLAIYNRLVIRNWSGAVFGHHGIVNLIFYLALIVGAVNIATAGEGVPGVRVSAADTFGTIPMVLVIGSLAALAWHSWQHQQAPISEKILVVVIETLETLIGYVSNTLSFLRVAAFSLNHVALSIAIFTLAGMMGAFGHVVTLILGNIFVIVLEGGIVMIQVMRLQYFEGFSRYFSGNGHEFAPLKFPRGSA